MNFVSLIRRIPVRLRRSLKRGLRKKQPAKYRPGGNEYSGDHESGGMGLGVTLIPGYMNNFNTGQWYFDPLPEMCLPLLY